MDRRTFLLSALSLPFAASGCILVKYSRIDPDHILVRSDRFNSVEEADAVVKKARLEWTPDGAIRVLYVTGTPYERGYQHGVLLRDEIQRNLGALYEGALKKFNVEELFDESYERQRPFIPQEYVDEMHGLAHGSRMPLRVIHAIHALPEIGEWGGKRKIKEVVKRMMDGDLGTSCSNLCALGDAVKGNPMYAVRVLDWGLHRVSKLHEYPLIVVGKPEKGNIYCNIGWVGFLGAISGMNEQGITLGEMGYGDPEGETMRGKPMPFLLRDVLTYANNLPDVRRIIQTSPGTNAFIFLMTDGKAKKGEIYVREKDRFKIFKPGELLEDRNNKVPPIKDIVYGGHFNEKMTESLTKHRGEITPEILMNEIIPEIAMKSNFQDVVYDPVNLKFWVANAADKHSRAADGTYTEFNFAEAIQKIKSGT